MVSTPLTANLPAPIEPSWVLRTPEGDHRSVSNFAGYGMSAKVFTDFLLIHGITVYRAGQVLHNPGYTHMYQWADGSRRPSQRYLVAIADLSQTVLIAERKERKALIDRLASMETAQLTKEVARLKREASRA